METLKEAFLAKFPKGNRIIAYFEEANGCECTWENLSKIRLQRYVKYLSERMAPNSVKAYCSKLKTVLTMYNEEVELPRDYQKVLQIRLDASQHIYLTDNEIKKLIRYEPRTQSERIIKNWFLIGCLTGARHSDYITFNSTNIQEGELRYVSIKTHIPAAVPLSPYAMRLIKEDDENGYNKIHYTDVYFNRVIKRLCRIVGIDEIVTLYCFGKFHTRAKWEFVTSHTARRSFATNLYKAGVDIYTISRLCGHASVEMTKQYICCGPRLEGAAINYFKTYK